MTISESYRELNAKLHASNEFYGTSGAKYSQQVHALALSLQTQDILDYGCGKSTLANNLPFKIKQYDPAIKKYEALPEPADLVVCTDVLEHIEPEKLDDVLGHLKSLTKRKGFFTIANRPARKTLEDGRNAHLIIEPPIYWLNKLTDYFTVVGFQDLRDEMLVVVEPK
jgi:2-polyprenyl-3-methyl-5-hydroxy-6-metoxy-1,4-benzoquinol methylase